MVPGFRLQQHGGSLDTGRDVWGSLDTGRAAGRLSGSMWNAARGLVEGLAMVGLQGCTLGALGVKRS